MEWPRILLLIATSVLFVPLSAVYFYRAYDGNEKRPAKILKGLNYILVATLIYHGLFVLVPVERFAIYMIFAVCLIGLVETVYHIDVFLDIKDKLRSLVAHRKK